MKKCLKLQPREKLWAWIERLAPECAGMTADELQEVLHEVSIESYARGSDAMAGIKNAVTR